MTSSSSITAVERLKIGDHVDCLLTIFFRKFSTYGNKLGHFEKSKHLSVLYSVIYGTIGAK